MTIIIRIGNTLIADDAYTSDGVAFKHSKLFKLADGTIFGMAGQNATPGMLNSQTAEELRTAFSCRQPSLYNAALLMIHSDGRCEQWWYEDKEPCFEAVYPYDAIGIGGYRAEWVNYLRSRLADQQTNSFSDLVEVAASFAMRVTGLWGFQQTYSKLSVYA